MQFTMNVDQAKNAGGDAHITETGAYAGTITKAVIESGVAPSQSKTLVLSLNANGAKANYVRINFIGKDGQTIFGMDMIHALMYLLRLNTMNTATRMGEPRNGKPAQQEEFVPDLEGKQIGMFLQKSFYLTQDGSEEKSRMELAQLFGPSTRKTVKEIVDNLEATTIAGLEANMTDYVPAAVAAFRKRGGKPQGGGNGGWGAQGGNGGGWGAPQQPDPDAVPYSRLQQANDAMAQANQPNQFDDDIPF